MARHIIQQYPNRRCRDCGTRLQKNHVCFWIPDERPLCLSCAETSTELEEHNSTLEEYLRMNVCSVIRNEYSNVICELCTHVISEGDYILWFPDQEGVLCSNCTTLVEPLRRKENANNIDRNSDAKEYR